MELLESLLVELDPVEDGFTGAFVEVYRHGNRYVLLVTACTTGNRLLRFTSEDRGLVYAFLNRELGGTLR